MGLRYFSTKECKVIEFTLKKKITTMQKLVYVR